MRSDVTPVADAPPTTRPYLLEQIDDAAVVQAAVVQSIIAD